MEMNAEMDVFQKIKDARNNAKFLQPLKQLCFEAVFNNTTHNHRWNLLTPELNDLFVKKLVKKFKGWFGFQSDFAGMIMGLVDENLRTMSWDFLDIFEGKSRHDLWTRLTTKSHFKLQAIVGQNTQTIRYHLLKSLQLFPDLQQLSIPTYELKCNYIDELPKLLPRLRILEFEVKCLKKCCQNGLCGLSQLEQLAIGQAQGNSRSKRQKIPKSSINNHTLWATLMQKLPHLQVLSVEPLEDHVVPDLKAALAELQNRGHEQPLQLRRLGITSRGPGKLENLPSHLLSCVSTLHIKDLSAKNCMMLIKRFGANLTHLKVQTKKELDINLVASYCPMLEDLKLDCGIIGESQCSSAPPTGHFVHMRRFKIKAEGVVPVDFMRLVLEAPDLEYLSLDSICFSIEKLLIAALGAMDVDKALKNLLKFKARYYTRDEFGPESRYGVGLKAILVAAPRLQHLNIGVTCCYEQQALEDISSKHFPDLRIDFHVHSYFSSDEEH